MKFDGSKINRFVVDEFSSSLFPSEEEKRRLLKMYDCCKPVMTTTEGITTLKIPITLADLEKTLAELEKMKPKPFVIEFHNQAVYDEFQKSINEYITLKGRELKYGKS